MSRLSFEQLAEIRARDERWAVPLTLVVTEVNSPFLAVEDRRALLGEIDENIAAVDLLVRFINAQGLHMPNAWKIRLVEAFGLEIDEANPYKPVRRPP